MSVIRLTAEEGFVYEHWPNPLDRIGRPTDFMDTITGDLIEVKQGDLSPGQLDAFFTDFNNGGHPKLVLVRRSRIFVLELTKIIETPP